MDDFSIIKGTLKYGYGSYKEIIDDNELWSFGEEVKQPEANWKRLLKKISKTTYAEDILADPEVEKVGYCYIADYLNTRLLYILSEIESTKFIKE